MAVTARFTPSVLDGELLEDLFVAREHLVADAIGRIERAATSNERSARLFVGPRGAGKTHLLSLVAHRARSLDGFGSRFQLAWLPEDLWTIDGYEDLLGEVIRAVEPPLDADHGTAIDRLRAAVDARGPVVVLVENLDRVFGDIGEDGQRRLRALIENDRSLLLIATTTRLDDELRGSGYPMPDDTEQPAYFREADWPFYGFFDTYELAPFTLDQATEMLIKIAAASGDENLAAELERPTIRRRLAAIDRLAGGQPRMWALLAAGLSIEGLDELVEALMTRFDDLTPYFQSQMQTLSPQERKVVRALADAPGSLNVGQIAERSGIGEKSVARTITGLRKRGWLRLRTGPIVAKADGRLSYYDLAEPLARLAFQLKESRGQPVRTVVEFLKHWFDADALTPLGTDPSVDAYLLLAGTEARTDPWLRVARSMSDPRGGEFESTDSMFAPRFVPDAEAIATSLASLDDAIAAWQEGDPGPLLAQPVSVTALVEQELADDPEGHRTRTKVARLALDVGPPETWIDRVESTFAASQGDTRADSARVAVVWRARTGQDDAARSLIRVASEGAGPRVLLWLAGELVQINKDELAREVLDVVSLRDGPSYLFATMIEEAILLRRGMVHEAVALWERTEEQINDLDATSRSARLSRAYRANAHARAGDRAGADAMWDALLVETELAEGRDHKNSIICRGNVAMGLAMRDGVDSAVDMLNDYVADCQRVFGMRSPQTLSAQHALGTALSRVDVHQAVEVLEAVLATRREVLGRRHPDSLITMHNLAVASARAGDRGRAAVLLAASVSGLRKSAGPDHPHTRRAERSLRAMQGTAGTEALDGGEGALGDDALGAEEGTQL